MSREELVERADRELDKLMALLPFAHATGAITIWSRLYTEGLMLKLRAMK